MMDCEDGQRKNIINLASDAKKLEMDIFEKETRIKALTKENEKLEKETARMDEETAEWEVEKQEIEEEIEQLQEILQHEIGNVQLAEKSYEIHKQMLKKEIEEAERLDEEYVAVLKEMKDELEDQRQYYAKTSPAYQEFRDKEVEYKKLNFEVLTMRAEIKTQRFIEKQREEIDWLMVKRDVVKFAQSYLDYQTRMRQAARLKELKKEEQELLKQYMEFQRRKKAARLGANVYSEDPRYFASLAIDEEIPPIQFPIEQKKDPLKEKLESFMNQMKEIPHPKAKLIIEEDRKVHVLDIQVLEPPETVSPVKPEVNQQPEPLLMKNPQRDIQGGTEKKASPYAKPPAAQLFEGASQEVFSPPRKTSEYFRGKENIAKTPNMKRKVQNMVIPPPNTVRKQFSEIRRPEHIMPTPDTQYDYETPHSYSQEGPVRMSQCANNTSLSQPLNNLNMEYSSQRSSQKRKEHDDMNETPAKRISQEFKRPIIKPPTLTGNRRENPKTEQEFAFGSTTSYGHKKSWEATKSEGLFGTSFMGSSGRPGGHTQKTDVSTWYTPNTASLQQDAQELLTAGYSGTESSTGFNDGSLPFNTSMDLGPSLDMNTSFQSTDNNEADQGGFSFASGLFNFGGSA